RSPLIAAWDQIKAPLPMLREQNGYAAYLPISGTHDEYLGTLSSNFARNVRRLNNKINTIGEPEFLFFTSDEIRDEHLEWFMKLEVSGWKGERGTAISQSPQLIAFYRSLISRMRARGWAEWHFLTVDGEPFAGHLAARIGRELVLLKIAYDDAHSSYGPGTILMSGLFERTFAAGDIDEINCLTDMAWNHNWQMKIRPYYDLHIFRRNPLSMLGGYWPSKFRERAGSVGIVRQAARRIRGLVLSKAK
ncbi:MAG TPA: GNAT family N-acetyltransferase, partial [Candidatus Acidoferrum sp.]|nr:GNAT family N-acetyltransferase [Candidatus Acidoferrum sp.]